MISVEAANAILQENFADWIRDLGITVIATETDCVTMHVPFSDYLCRIGGTLCGQSLISAADTAMVIALANSNGGMRAMTTVDLTSNFMRAISNEDAIVVAKVVRFGRTMAFCTTEVSGAQSAKVSAFATGTYAILG